MHKHHEITPWDTHNASQNSFVANEVPPTEVQTTQHTLLIPLNTEMKHTIIPQSRSIPKRQKKFISILPRVYEKHPTLPQFPYSKPTNHKRYQFLPKPLSKNELIIQIPRQIQQLPKMQLDHPIRHSTKLSKYLPLDQNEHKQKHQDQQLQQLKRKVRKSSVDISHMNILNKLNNYEEQIIKKCSLRNLKIYEKEDKVQEKIKKLNKKEENKTHKQQHQKKHILDRILSRLE